MKEARFGPPHVVAVHLPNTGIILFEVIGVAHRRPNKHICRHTAKIIEPIVTDPRTDASTEIMVQLLQQGVAVADPMLLDIELQIELAATIC